MTPEQNKIYDSSLLPSSRRISRLSRKQSVREKLEILLKGELDFHGKDSAYASHNFHAFAAKFPPQLPRVFICGLTKPGDTILDPMMGSGTTILEALLGNRKAIGLDIDPLAVSLTRVKTNPIDIQRLQDTAYNVVSKANNLLWNGKDIEQIIQMSFDDKTREFINYWFLSETQRQLMALALSIKDVENIDMRRFVELIFSSIIITKSGGVSMARDLAHSRPHLDKTKVPRNAIEQFTKRLKSNLANISGLKTNGANALLLTGDARAMPIADETIDLIVTSPPYANAIDYMRAHKFSLVWFGKSVSQLAELRAKYIGSECVGKGQFPKLPKGTENLIELLDNRDAKKAKILRKYFSEMRLSLSEMLRVLRNDSAAIVVVGSSIMRDIDVETHLCIAEIAKSLGFDVAGIAKRVLDRNKRMMPARFGKKSDSIIENRMHEEYVIGLLKTRTL